MLTFSRELASFLFQRKKFWLVPVLVMSTLLGGFLALAQGSAIAPLIYTLF
jgi:hypothetical protein